MSLIAFTLIGLSAFSHASWNFASKRRSPSLAFFWIAVVAAAIFVSPLLVIHRHAIPLLPGSVWLLMLATGTAQLIYFFGLTRAYRSGDISLAYPLARAMPVLMIALISILLGRGGQIGGLGLLGMGLITVGCIILPMQTFQQMHWRNYVDVVTLMALVAAIGTTAYTLIDDQVQRQLRETPALMLDAQDATLLFISLQTISTAVMLGLGTLLLKSERRLLPGMLRNRSLLLMGMLTGIVVMGTYGLALAAMAYVTNVSYVAAFRQLSIPIGALLGFTIAHEPRYRPKLWGIGIVTLGLVFVGMG